ncbi:MAG: DNA polymerase III subunit delta [Candidatus Cloacimonadota bacterium]|nr:MAG: DNA polymerase III subunit delta [Candidatus Cloacimonadota bacterium]
MKMKSETIFREIKEGKLFDFYFLSGENEYKIQEVLQTLTKAVLNTGFESFDLEKFDAGEKSFALDSLSRAVLTPPMASLKRLIFLAQVEKLTASDRAKLLTLIESRVNTGILVMIASPSAKVKGEFYNKIKSKSRSENFKKLKTDSLEKWIIDYVGKRGCSIEKEAALAIIEFSGDNQISLSGEIEKMITFVGEKKALKKVDVLNILTSNKVKNVFDLKEAIGKRELKNALSILNYLLEWGEVPEIILAVLRNFFLRLRGVLYYKRKGLLYNDIVKKMRVMSFIISKEMNYLRNFSQDELKVRLNLLYDAEVRMKTGWDVNLVLTDLVYNLI